MDNMPYCKSDKSCDNKNPHICAACESWDREKYELDYYYGDQ
jgi:hypothetical protein